jgi:DNA-binding beta-propeller fold protein YncE
MVVHFRHKHRAHQAVSGNPDSKHSAATRNNASDFMNFSRALLWIPVIAATAFFHPARAANQVMLNGPGLEAIGTGALYPEGIEFNPKTGKFLLCSFREGVVYEVATDGTYRPLVQDERLITGMGIRVDVQRNRLLVVTADVGISVRRSAGGPGTFAALGVYELSTGKPISFTDLGKLRPDGEKHIGNDVAVDAEGNAYVTDSLAPVIYKVDLRGNATVFLESKEVFVGEGINLNGIVYHPQGYLIVAKKNDGALFKVPLNNPQKFSKIRTPRNFVGADGLALVDGSNLVVVTNRASGISSDTAYAIRSLDQWESAELVGEYAFKDDNYPTTSVVKDGKIYVVSGRIEKLQTAAAAERAGGYAQKAIIQQIGTAGSVAKNAWAEIMVVGIDRKFAYDQNAVRQALEPGHDEVQFFDLRSPEKPALVGTIRLENSILGPPTNVAVTPDQSLALIANAVRSEKTEAGFKAVPADELFVVDLRASPPALLQTLKVGRQPSGIAISKDGRFALVANRDSKSISVLTINGRAVAVSDTVSMGEAVGAIAISPDGRRAIATKTGSHKAALLNISQSLQVTLDRDLWVGLFPWNVAISPDGRMAIVNNIGNAGQSDGSAKTVSVIDLAAQVPFVREHVSVGDAPEGVVFSPDGKFAALTILQGSYDAPEGAWFRHPTGQATLLSIAQGRVSVADSVDVGAFPEGIGFSQDGKHIYVGNYRSDSISILEIDSAGRLVDTKKQVSLSGPPASLRIGAQ